LKIMCGYPDRFKYAGVLLLLTLVSMDTTAQELKGSWIGWVQASDFLGAMRVDVNDAGAGTLTLFYAGDKRAGPLESLQVKGDEVYFEAKLQPNGRFRGKMVGSKLSGTWESISRAGTVADKGAFDLHKVDTNYQPKLPAPVTDASTGLPTPSGTYRIARRLYFWVDESRLETITTDAADKRRVFVQLWYPADGSKGRSAEYIPVSVEPDEARSASFQSIKTHAVVDAAFAHARERFPLIIFSPGLGSDPFRYAAIIEELVSHGYVVAAINHPYDSGSALWPDGTTVKQDKKWDGEVPKDWSADERRKFFDQRRYGWAADVSFVVDQIRKLDIAKNMDLDRLGMLGHSFGGQAASIVCASDPRFKACANLDGLSQGLAILPNPSGKTMTQPFLFFTKVPELTDAELEMTGLSREEYRTREKKRLMENWKPGFRSQIASVESGGYLLVYPGITHTTFSDNPLIDSHSSKTLDERLRTAVVINTYIRAFFDKVLLGKDSALLEPGPSKNGVIVEFLRK
jgi:hypothetical protein